MWTIEQGDQVGRLHLNLIIDAPTPPDAGDIVTAWRSDAAEVWAKSIPRSQIRNVAAYVSKRRQMPTTEAYEGRIFGTWGTWRGAAEVMQSRDMVETAPIVAGLAIEQDMARLEVPEPEIPREERIAIARRHMPRLYAAIRGTD